MGQRKILIVEDNATSAELIRLWLIASNYEVTIARDGLEGLGKVQEIKPDLILSDVLMPKMTGYQMVEKIRSLDRDVKNVPVIVISAKQSMKDRFDSSAIFCFMSKPIHREELLKRVAAALGPVQESSKPSS